MAHGGLVTIPPKNTVGLDSELSDKLGYYIMIGSILSFLTYAGYRLYKAKSEWSLIRVKKGQSSAVGWALLDIYDNNAIILYILYKFIPNTSVNILRRYDRITGVPTTHKVIVFEDSFGHTNTVVPFSISTEIQLYIIYLSRINIWRNTLLGTILVSDGRRIQHIGSYSTPISRRIVHLPSPNRFLWMLIDKLVDLDMRPDAFNSGYLEMEIEDLLVGQTEYYVHTLQEGS